MPAPQTYQPEQTVPEQSPLPYDGTGAAVATVAAPLSYDATTVTTAAATIPAASIAAVATTGTATAATADIGTDSGPGPQLAAQAADLNLGSSFLSSSLSLRNHGSGATVTINEVPEAAAPSGLKIEREELQSLTTLSPHVSSSTQPMQNELADDFDCEYDWDSLL